MSDLQPAHPGRVVLALLVLVQVGGVAAATQLHGPGAGFDRPRRVEFDGRTFNPLVEQGIREGVYPGAALAIGRRDTVLFMRGYGHLTWSASSPPVDPESTLYDLASLTKVIATTTSLMLLVDRGKVRIDVPVATYLPEFNGPGTAGITVRQLLTHTSGLRPTLALHHDALPPDSAAALRMVYAATPEVPPGSRVIYSDLNAILLGEIVRCTAGEPLEAFVAHEVFVPLQLGQTLFRPTARLRARIAPTGLWRGHPIAAVVNDPTAARLGGVAGNAGLFASVADVARFAQFVLREGTLPPPDGRQLVRPETVRQFTTPATPIPRGTHAEVRTLGWQALPTGETVSSAGTLFGPRSFGHTGWTGTSLWIDPERDLFVVLLTNRAFAPRAGRSFTLLKGVRGRIADAAAQASDAR